MSTKKRETWYTSAITKREQRQTQGNLLPGATGHGPFIASNAVCKQSVVNAYGYSFFVNLIFIWNRLPFSIVFVSSYNIFCSSVYKFLCVDS